MEVGGHHNALTDFQEGNRLVTLYTGRWVAPRAGVEGCGNSRHTGFRSPDGTALIESLYRLYYPGPQYHGPSTHSFWVSKFYVGKQYWIFEFELRVCWRYYELYMWYPVYRESFVYPEGVFDSFWVSGRYQDSLHTWHNPQVSHNTTPIPLLFRTHQITPNYPYSCNSLSSGSADRHLPKLYRKVQIVLHTADIHVFCK